jgi:CO/xanthine dehydrogenase Mo-binding subunit
VTQSLQLAEMCRMARATPLWRDREQARRAHAARGLLHGVGFALANEAYGTNTDGVMAAVEIDEEGAITVTTNAVDMGTGSATSLAISTAGALGANAKQIEMGNPAVFAALGFVPDLPPQAQVWTNPRWTPVFSLSSSASITAFQQVHVVEQASSVLREVGLLPAARKLWKIGANELRADDVGWVDGALVAPGRAPLPLPALAKQVFADGGVVGAMVHGLHQGRWVVASYDVGKRQVRAPIDGLSTRLARTGSWRAHDRQQVAPPPSDAKNYGRNRYAPSATLAAVEIDPRTGSVKVTAIASWLEAGRVIQPDLMMGQYYGGVAMGVGYALSEYLPRTTGGAGDGTWNFHRYHLPLARDLPLDRIELHLMTAAPDEPPRGIAEAVLCPVAAAIANAIASATGRRFRALPITPAKILEGLRA